MTTDVREEVGRLLRAGDRPQAIEYLQHTFNISSEDAAKLVEALERETGIVADTVAAPSADTSTDTSGQLHGSLKADVIELLIANRKLEAVQLVRNTLHVTLPQSLLMVGQIAREINPNYVSVKATGCFQVFAKGMGVFLMVVCVFLLAAAAAVYFFQSESIGNSDRVTGTVTEMKSLDTGESAPVIEYEWLGNKRSYESTFYSSPPDYHVGQSVPLFVNRDDPDDITLDTFIDRWAIIVALAVPGAFLGVISIVFMYFGRRKF